MRCTPWPHCVARKTEEDCELWLESQKPFVSPKRGEGGVIWQPGFHLRKVGLMPSLGCCKGQGGAL